jgi:excisionase family DNA binding protein
VGEEKTKTDEVMDCRTLAAYLKLAEGTLRHYVMDRSIPFVKVGSHVRFLKGEIDKWLLERNRRPAGRPKGGADKDEGGQIPWGAALEDKEQAT